MKDYGCDPICNGKFRMVPSGDIVGIEERNKRLPLRPHEPNQIFGMSWKQLEDKQGGKLKMTNEDAVLLRQHLLDIKAERNAYKKALEKIADMGWWVGDEVREIARQALKNAGREG